jgi:asparagine synthase (glutamine-hydrolysing)
MVKGTFKDKNKREFSYSPLCEFATGQVSVTLFGRIYCGMESVNAPFGSNEAEKIWSLFEKESYDGLKHLDGSFLLLIEFPDTMLIVRDRHGAGPSFYYTDTHFSFSLFDLISISETSHVPDPAGMIFFLRYGYIAYPDTSLKGVKKLPGGVVLICKKDSQVKTLTPLFTYEDFVQKPSTKSLKELSSEYGLLHQQAIKKRIEGHHRIGVLLSGGYDSGSNLFSLRKVFQGSVDSFSIGFKGNPWTELPVAREMSSIFGTRHYEYEIDGSEITSLPEIVKTLGDPFTEGGLMVNYAVMKLVAGNRPDMILGGDGSDQYFGTGGRELALHYLTRRSGAYPLLRFMSEMMDRECFDSDGSFFRLRFHLRRVLDVQSGDQFGFSDRQMGSLLQQPPENWKHSIQKLNFQDFDQLYTLHRYKCDIQKTIDQVIVFKASKMAEAFNNTLSFPYLDNALYQFLKTVPVSYQCNGKNIFQIAQGKGVAKFLLKSYYKPFLPDCVTQKKKQGGFAPMSLFFQSKAQRARLVDFVLNSTLCQDLLKRDVLDAWFKGYEKEIENKEGWFWYSQSKAFQFFDLVTLAVWWEIFVHRKEVSFL